MIITFSGVDGSGKSTLLLLLKDKLSNYTTREIISLRSRPSIFPILSSFIYGKESAEKHAASVLPRKGNNKSSILSYFRFFYYLIDYILGGVLLRFKYRGGKYILLYDRYYFDYIVDPKRFNLIISERFVKFIYNIIIPVAEINFFIHADADVVLSRKNELKREDILFLNKRYEQLFTDYGADNGFYILENSHLSSETVINELIKILRYDKKSIQLFNKA